MLRRRFRETCDVREVKGNEKNEIKRISKPISDEAQLIFEALFADDYGMSSEEYLKLHEGR